MSAFDKSLLRRSVAKLLIVRASGHCEDSQREYPRWELSNRTLKRLLGDGVGGVILFGGTTNELQCRCRTLKDWSDESLLLCADIEEGLGQRFKGGTWLVPPMAIARMYIEEPRKAIQLAEEYGICIGRQARISGLNWVLAPVCDIDTNPLNPVINLRAWGEDPQTVSALVCAFQKGVSSQGVLTCAKHFPGHGDTKLDSHMQLPILNHDLERLNQIELVPFKALIESGVDSVMSAHILLPKIDSNFPSTLSREIIGQLLRKKIGFDGVVVSDALIMAAITQSFGPGDAAILAFEAGVDLIIMPEDPEMAIEAISNALLTGRIPMKNLDNALQRRKKLLAKVKEFTPKTIASKFNQQVENFEIESGKDKIFSENLIQKSIKIRNLGQITINQPTINFLQVPDIFPCQFLTACSPSLIIPEALGFKTVLSHAKGVSPWKDDSQEPLALERFGGAAFFLQLFVRGNPFVGDGFMKLPWLAAIKQLQRHHRLSGLVVYGSPYLWKQLDEVVAPSIPFAFSPGQMPEAQKQVLSLLFSKNGVKNSSGLTKEFRFTD